MRSSSRLAFPGALATLVASVSCAAAMAVQAPVATAGGVRFTFAHAAAKSVAVVGNFNGWSSTANPLTRNGPGALWNAVVELPPGEHLFMFLVDGKEWVVPPLAEDYVDDGFGSKNGVVVVRPRER